MRRAILATMACALTWFGACKKHEPRPQLDACALLTAEDIQEVQQAPLKNKVGNHSDNGRTYVSQCYFAADPPHQSVSLATTQADPAGKGPDAAREYWRQISASAQQKEHGENDQEREKRESLREHEREEEAEGAVLRKIDGVGEEAYWAGSRVGGALYVFGKDVVLRISVGGPDTDEAKIEKSKKLAAKALQRL